MKSGLEGCRSGALMKGLIFAIMQLITNYTFEIAKLVSDVLKFVYGFLQ